MVGCGKKTDTYAPRGLDELSGHTVCCIEGSIQQEYVTKHLQGRGINLITYPSGTDCLLALKNGKADVFFAGSLFTYNEGFKRQNMKVSAWLKDIQCPVALGIRKDDSRLLDDFNAFEDSLYKAGVIDDIRARWLNPDNTDFHNSVRIPPTSGKVSGIPENKVLRVGIAGVAPPMEVLIDNKWTGGEIELLQRYAIARGLQLQIDVYAFNNLISALESGKVDIIAAMLADNAERRKKISFANSHIAGMAVLIVPNAGQTFPQTYDDLEGIKESIRHSLIVENRWKLLVEGLWITIFISVLSLILGSILGGGLCWMTMNRRPSSGS